MRVLFRINLIIRIIFICFKQILIHYLKKHSLIIVINIYCGKKLWIVIKKNNFFNIIKILENSFLLWCQKFNFYSIYSLVNKNLTFKKININYK